jgi:hypothetical protein
LEHNVIGHRGAQYLCSALQHNKVNNNRFEQYKSTDFIIYNTDHSNLEFELVRY